MNRVLLVDGPLKGRVHEHDGGPLISQPHVEMSGEILELFYRIFAGGLQAARVPEARRAGAELLAAQWCRPCDMFRDRCQHAPPPAMRRWTRFGPRFDRTQLDPSSPASRPSKWHWLMNARQTDEPWLTQCGLIVYGPIIEEYSHATLTPIGVAMCSNCKAIAGIQERIPPGVALAKGSGDVSP